MSASSEPSASAASTCSICFDEINEANVVKMPCCHKDSSSIHYCFPCVSLIARNGIDGSIGRCPTCRKHYTLSERGIRIFTGPAQKCRVCCQTRELADPSRQLCDKCLYGQSYAFNYECSRCHNTQRIAHPMWMYQPSPESFGTASWACHRGCADYTFWRIVDPIDRIPMDHVPESWNMQGAFREQIRALRRQESEGAHPPPPPPPEKHDGRDGSTCSLS